MSEENDNEDIVDITAVLNKVVDKLLDKKTEAYVRKELNPENMQKHFEVVCTEGYHVITAEENRIYEENRLKYPVNIDGVWYSIVDINRPNIKRRRQLFFDQVVGRALYSMLEFKKNIGFWGIRKYYKEIEFMFSCLLNLYENEDYDKRIKKAISHNAYRSRTKIYYEVKNVIINPLQNKEYCEKVVLESFHKDVSYWNDVLDRYQRNNAYINRLHYLIEQMDELEKLEIPYLHGFIISQRNIYFNRLHL